MNYLLDSHTFLWLDDTYENLSPAAQTIIADIENTLFISAASVWEIQIKAQLGKLGLRVALPILIEEQQERNDIQVLSITLNHIFELINLPHHHRDPFDRLLIAQSRIEAIPIISHDTKIAEYDVDVIW